MFCPGSRTSPVPDLTCAPAGSPSPGAVCVWVGQTNRGPAALLCLALPPSGVKAQGAGHLLGHVGGLWGSAFWGHSSVHRRQGSPGRADQPGGPRGTNVTNGHLLGGDSLLLFYLGRPLCQGDQGSPRWGFEGRLGTCVTPILVLLLRPPPGLHCLTLN